MQDVSKYKILFLGSSKVGKTNLIARYINNTFIGEHYPTHELT
jgi:GTPase SAR1 family protein